MQQGAAKSIQDEKWFDYGVYAVASLIVLIILYPLVFIVSASFSDPAAVMYGKMWLWPKGFTLQAYQEILKYKDVWTGYRNTVLYTLAGTSVNIVMTSLAAYPLSRKDLPGKNVFMFLIIFTMFLQGGLIPTYLLVKDLHMVHTFWAMIIPNAIATYHLIVMRSYFQTGIPWELQEAGTIDGCSNIGLFLRIILPLSKPIIAVIVLFYLVGHWNAYFNALIYLDNQEMYPLQLILRQILIMNQVGFMDETFGMSDKLLLAESMKYALIIVACLPVLIVYPFVQRHFVKGVMIGSLKG